MARSREQMLSGRATAPPPRRPLRAGPLTAVLEEGDLRRVRLGTVELVQRIYVAVRDEHWNTIPATYTDWDLAIADDHFRVGFTARHRYGAIDFTWRGQIVGTAEGTVAYSMDGVAGADFRYCKIGFNVHHPLHGSVGRPFHARTPDGPIDGVLPARIEPQRFAHGTLTAMFAPYDCLTIEPRDGLTVRFDFAGDLFEMQDHRNWTDANFKSYGTPLSVPFPMDAHAGQVVRQSVTVSVDGTVAPMLAEEPLRMEIGQSTGGHLPPIGTCLADHAEPPSAREAGLLRALRLDHLRIDLHIERADWQEELRRGAAACAGLDTRPELALYVSEDSGAAVEACAAQLTALALRPARLLVFQASGGRNPMAGSTPARLVDLVRTHLGAALADVQLAGGTKQFFAEINRDPPQVEAMGAVVFSINPQVHACDDTSLVENLAAQADAVISARALCDDRPVAISPVTLIGREGPYAAGPQLGGLPGNVDVRQASLFAAGWTACSVRYLAEGGTASLTYYETTGWLGLIERDAGPPLPDLFPSHPGMVFPLYHVFADLAEWKAGDLLELRSSDPLAADGLVVRAGGIAHLLLANLTDWPQTLTAGPFSGNTVRLRPLDEHTAAQATDDPARFRAGGTVERLRCGWVDVSLAPRALLRIDEVAEP